MTTTIVEKPQWIITDGDVPQELDAYGPFPTKLEAIAWAKGAMNGDWEVSQMYPPNWSELTEEEKPKDEAHVAQELILKMLSGSRSAWAEAREYLTKNRPDLVGLFPMVTTAMEDPGLHQVRVSIRAPKVPEYMVVDYVKDALWSHGGGMHPTHPLFHAAVRQGFKAKPMWSKK